MIIRKSISVILPFIAFVLFICVISIVLKAMWMWNRPSVLAVILMPIYTLFNMYILHRLRFNKEDVLFFTSGFVIYHIIYMFAYICDGPFYYEGPYYFPELYFEVYPALKSIGYCSATPYEWLSLVLLVVMALHPRIMHFNISLLIWLFMAHPLSIMKSVSYGVNYMCKDNSCYIQLVSDTLYSLAHVLIMALFLNLFHAAVYKLISYMQNNSKLNNHNVVSHGVMNVIASFKYIAVDIMVITCFICANYIPQINRQHQAHSYNKDIEDSGATIVGQMSRGMKYYCLDNELYGHKVNPYNWHFEMYIPSSIMYLINSEYDVKYSRVHRLRRESIQQVALLKATQRSHSGGSLPSRCLYILCGKDRTTDIWIPLYASYHYRNVLGSTMMCNPEENIMSFSKCDAQQ